MPGNGFWELLLHHIAGGWGKVDWTVIPVVLILEDRRDIHFSSVFEYFSQLPWSNIIKSGLVMTSTCSLSTCRSSWTWRTSGTRDLCKSKLPKYFLTSSSPTKHTASLLQIFPEMSSSWGSWRPELLEQAEVKAAFVHQPFPMFSVTRDSASFSRPTFAHKCVCNKAPKNVHRQCFWRIHLWNNLLYYHKGLARSIVY